MTTQQHILIVDDDAEIRSLTGQFLEKYGYQVSLASDGDELFKQFNASPNIDLVILDVMMPGDDGFTCCRNLRAVSNVPIIMLTAVSEETDRIVGLEMGADDYLAKPFNPRELLARIKAILRRSEPAPEIAAQAEFPCLYQFEGWSLDMATHTLRASNNDDVGISAGELTLLCAFLDRPQQVLSRDQLLEHTHNRSAGPFDRSIDVQVSRLRQKVEVDPKNPLIIKTVRGGGYLFTPKVIKSHTRAETA